jgi:hypothetical protein
MVRSSPVRSSGTRNVRPIITQDHLDHLRQKLVRHHLLVKPLPDDADLIEILPDPEISATTAGSEASFKSYQASVSARALAAMPMTLKLL